MRIVRRTIASCAVLGAVAAVLGDPRPAAAQAAPPRDWTILVYMAADNALDQFVLDDLDEIEAGLPQAGRVEVLALVDRASGRPADDDGWQGGRLYRVLPNRQPGVLASQLVQDLGEIDTGDPERLAETVAWAFKDYPAERTGLVLWGYGNGWAGLAHDATLPDRPTGETDYLTLPELATGVRDGLARAGIARLDLIGFDMGLMAQLEVAVEMAPLARVMVASQAIAPGDGWPYDRFLAELAEGDVSPREFAARIVEDHHARHIERGEQRATLSALDLDGIEGVAGAVDELVAALGPSVAESWPDLSRSLFWATGFAPGGRIRDLEAGRLALHSVDLADLARRFEANLGQRFAARPQLEALDAALKAAVIANLAGGSYGSVSGLAIYAPLRWTSVDPAYADTRFAEVSGWPVFLARLHARQTEQAEPVAVREVAVVSGVDGRPVDKVALGEDAIARIRIAGDNALLATLTIGRDEPSLGGTVIESVGLLVDTATIADRAGQASDVAELLAPVYAPDGAELSTDLPGVNMLAASGAAFAQPTLETSRIRQDAEPAVSARAWVERQGSPPTEAIVGFDGATRRATTITLLLPDGKGRTIPHGLAPRPDDRVTFLAGVIKPDRQDTTWVPAGPAMLWGEGPELLFNLAPAGRYTLEVAVEAIGGATERTRVPAEVVNPVPAVLREIHAAKSFTLADLAGEWQVENGTRLFRLTPVQGVPEQLDVTLLAEPIAHDFAAAGVTRSRAALDSRRLPTLEIRHTDAHGRLVLAEDNLFFAAPEHRDRIRLRSLASAEHDTRGQLVTLYRTGSAAAAQAEATVPAAGEPQPETAAATSPDELGASEAPPAPQAEARLAAASDAVPRTVPSAEVEAQVQAQLPPPEPPPPVSVTAADLQLPEAAALATTTVPPAEPDRQVQAQLPLPELPDPVRITVADVAPVEEVTIQPAAGPVTPRPSDAPQGGTPPAAEAGTQVAVEAAAPVALEVAAEPASSTAMPNAGAPVVAAAASPAEPPVADPPERVPAAEPAPSPPDVQPPVLEPAAPLPRPTTDIAPGLDPRLVGSWYGDVAATQSFVLLVLDPTGNLVQTEVMPDGRVLQVAGRWTSSEGALEVEIQQVFPAQPAPPRVRTPFTLSPDGQALQTATARLRRL